MDSMGTMMSVGGLVVTLVVVAFSVFMFLRVFGGLGRASAERQRLLREGMPASARLLAVQMGGMTMQVGVHRHLQLQLHLEVQPPGRPPYQAMLTTMVSELQIPQLQPGAMLAVRIDPRDGSKLALEGALGPGAAPYAPAGYGAPPMGAPPPYGAPGPYGAPAAYGAPGMVPIGGTPRMPAGAKIGMWIGIAGALVGVGVAVVVVLVNVGGVGLGSASEGSGVCARAVRCCEAAAGSNPSAANCKNLGKLGVPESACQQSLESFRQSAKAQGRTCP